MSKNNTSILIVDDQPDNLRSLSQILQKRGYRVRQAKSGSTALRTAASQPPDLILLDIRMPKMDGYAVCAALKEAPETREIPIIFLSALNDAAEKVKAFHTGGVDYITKPFEVAEVLARIDNHLHLRQQQQQTVGLLRQMLQLNTSLQQQVQAQTLELDLALQYEQTLQQISDRVRSSLDITYILQAAVEELDRVLQTCDPLLFNADSSTEVFFFQAASCDRSEPFNAVSALLKLPGIRPQLEQGWTFAFCSRADAAEASAADRGAAASASLACPIYDDRDWQGMLWLFKPAQSCFSDREIRLVQQIANQCAIALRQARLYQEAQTQIVELHRLHQLKDDFLNTVSHELRTPVANMRMVLQLLTIATEQGQTFLAQMGGTESTNNRIAEYFRILQEECEREIRLIQDLLDLQQLAAGVRQRESTTLGLNDWLLHLLEPYALRIQTQQQTLSVQTDPDLPPCTTDLLSLTRIVTELLDNACKYTAAGEAIAVSTCATATDLILRVSNSGVEISPAEQNRVFDKFYRIPHHDPWSHSGTGLGLALVRQLVNHIGGEIRVSSGDRWTHFTLQLPVAAPESES